MKFSQIDAIRVYREYCEENGWAFAPVPQALYCVAEAAVEAERVVVARSLARNWEHAARRWWAKLEDAMGVLSTLSSYLGAGLGEDTTTPDQYNERIRWGIDAMVQHQARIADGYKQQMIFECAGRDEKIKRLEIELGQVQELYELIGSIRSPEEKVSPSVHEAAMADLQEVGWELDRLRKLEASRQTQERVVDV